MGGQEDPCVPAHYLAKILEDTGRPCPRIELDPENAPAAELLGVCVKSVFDERFARALAVIGPFVFAAVLGEAEPDEVAPLLRRVLLATASEPVRSTLERAEREAMSRARRGARSSGQE